MQARSIGDAQAPRGGGLGQSQVSLLSACGGVTYIDIVDSIWSENILQGMENFFFAIQYIPLSEFCDTPY